MELGRRDFRAMILYDFKKDLTVDECRESLARVFGDSAPSRATIGNWFREFRRGRWSIEDAQRGGRPHTAVTPENIESVRKMILEDRHTTYVEIQMTLGIGSTAVNTILKDYLNVSKRCARWVPHSLTEEQKAARVEWCRFMLQKFENGTSRDTYNIVTGDESWIYHYDPKMKRQSAVWCFQNDVAPTKVRRSRSSGKKMVASFFTRRGHLKSVTLDTQRTVTAEWYVTHCLPQVITAWKESRPKSRMSHLQLHHDNASAHTAARTLDFLAKQKVRILPHPPYSPDLAPCDFFLFPKTKESLRGRKFSSHEEAVGAYQEALNDLPEEAWNETFTKWFRRMQKCISAHGEYFEKL